MRCSQKGGFVTTLLLIFVIPSEQINPPLSQEPKNFLARSTGLQGFDSFPDKDSRKLHKIVKKQMAPSEFENIEDDGSREETRRKVSRDPERRKRRNKNLFSKIKSVALEREIIFPGSVSKMQEPDMPDLRTMIGRPCEEYGRTADVYDRHSYFECEPGSDGTLVLQHKKCLEDEVFSPTYLECLQESYLHFLERSKRTPAYSKKEDPNPCPDGDIEPSNEWIDASQGSGTKIPSEFKPKKKPILRVYHLICKRDLERVPPEKLTGRRHVFNPFGSSQRRLMQRGRANKFHRHHPRSFLIRIKKKEKKNDQDEGIAENDEAEDDDDENDDDEDDEDVDEDDGEETEDDSGEENNATSEKSFLKEFFKTAKEAVTNRARFSDGSADALPSKVSKTSNLKKDESGSSGKPKKVLLDANIKVDGTLTNALKSLLGKGKDKLAKRVHEPDNDEDQIDQELTKQYENSIRSNPRLKRYFLSTRTERGY